MFYLNLFKGALQHTP